LLQCSEEVKTCGGYLLPNTKSLRSLTTRNRHMDHIYTILRQCGTVVCKARPSQRRSGARRRALIRNVSACNFIPEDTRSGRSFHLMNGVSLLRRDRLLLHSDQLSCCSLRPEHESCDLLLNATASAVDRCGERAQDHW